VTIRIGDILRLPGLALKLVGGEGGRDRTVRWVHVSELEDPTPWLKGGELLLTTGMGLGKSPVRQRAYVDRLADARLSGLGFGVGFTYTKVPKAVRDAADRLRFPVFEVPYPVPFIAITEAVFTRLAAEQVDVLQRSLEAQNSLTRAVLEGEGVWSSTSTVSPGGPPPTRPRPGPPAGGKSCGNPGRSGRGSACRWLTVVTTSRSSRWEPAAGSRRSW
jgi:purine catabolism regulator